MTWLELFCSVSVLLTILSRYSANGQLSNGPVNTAALVGTQAWMNCTVGSADTTVTWFLLNGVSAVAIYSTDSGVLPDFTTRYDVENYGLQQNLIILESNANNALPYYCLAGTTQTSNTAYFVAVEDLQCPDPGFEVLAGTEPSEACSVVYHSPTTTLVPTLTWSVNDSVTEIFDSSFSNSSFVSTLLNTTLEARHDAMNFTCELSFTGDDAPEYTASCTTFFYVLYSVSEITFELEPASDDSGNLAVGTTITCVANGRPAPAIIWLDGSGNTTVAENGTLTVDESMVGADPVTFICQATNEVGNDTVTIERNFTFVAVSVDVQPLKSGTETWVIVVAVVVPVVVLAAAGVAGFFIYRHHQKKKSKKKTYSSSTNGGTVTAASAAASQPVENQPFLYSANPPVQQPISMLPAGNGVSYHPGGQPRPGSTSGFADLGSPQNGNGTLNGSQHGGSTSRIVTPTPMTYPYPGPSGGVVGGGPGSVASSRGMPAMTAGQPLPYANSVGRQTPASDVNMRPNPVSYPYATTSRPLSNVSSASRGSSYHGGSQQNMGPAPLSFPPARSTSSHNSSLV